MKGERNRNFVQMKRRKSKKPAGFYYVRKRISVGVRISIYFRWAKRALRVHIRQITEYSIFARTTWKCVAAGEYITQQYRHGVEEGNDRNVHKKDERTLCSVCCIWLVAFVYRNGTSWGVFMSIWPPNKIHNIYIEIRIITFFDIIRIQIRAKR